MIDAAQEILIQLSSKFFRKEHKRKKKEEKAKLFLRDKSNWVKLSEPCVSSFQIRGSNARSRKPSAIPSRKQHHYLGTT